MILTAYVKKQLGTFVIISLVALGLMVLVYARIPASLGFGVYEVKAEFHDASGLYPKALVTFHGVDVGEVTALNLTPSVAVATLRLRSAVSIPANVVAQIHSTSAIGEQYVALAPLGKPRGHLTDGVVLTPARTVSMPQIAPVLDSLNHLLRSVPLEQTATVLDQVNQGIGSQGQQIGQLIDSSSLLVRAAQRQVAGTTALIRALERVLERQQSLASQTASYISSLDQFTQQVAARDTDLRTLLSRGPFGLKETGVTVGDLSASLPTLLQDLSVTGDVLHTYLPQLQQILVVYPATIARIQSAMNPGAERGYVQLDVRAGAGAPPSCSSGYLPVSQRRSPSAQAVRPVNVLAHCQYALDSPSAVRGARNLPCPNSERRGALPSACGLIFGKAVWPAGSRSSGSASTPSVTQQTGPGSTTGTAWEELFLQPLGLM